MRGVGFGVSITYYFGSLKNPKESRDELKDLKSVVMVMSNELKELRSIVKTGQSQMTHDNLSTATTEDHEGEFIPNHNIPIEFPEVESKLGFVLEIIIFVCLTTKIHDKIGLDCMRTCTIRP